MKSLFVIFCWLLLGFFFWTMSNSCCQSSGVAPSTTAVADDVVQDSNSQVAAPLDTSGIASAENMESTEVTSSPSIDYDYEEDKTILIEGEISRIPLSEENTFNDEIKAHLEQFCARMQNDLSKIHIQGNDVGDQLARETTMKMEDFLIVCGVSPNRIVRTNKKSGEGESHIKMYLR